MQIEKPRPALSRKAIFATLTVAIAILSLPFIAKTTTLKSVAKADPPAEKYERKKTAPELPVANIQTPTLVPPVPTPMPTVVDLASLPTPPSAVTTSKAVDSPDRGPTLQESPVAMISHFGDVKIKTHGTEEKAFKNRAILKDETIEVGNLSEAVLLIDDLYVLHLKPNTRLTQLEPIKVGAPSEKEQTVYRLKLEQGAILGTTKYRGDKTSRLNLLIKDKLFRVQDSTFRVQLSDATPWIGVLSGSIELEAGKKFAYKPLEIHAHEKIPLSDELITAPSKISRVEWDLLQEAREMNAMRVANEAQQALFEKNTGNFFQRVFDIGAFFTVDVGYAAREFYEDNTAGSVYFETEYDVFPENSFVGIYFLTRDLDIRDYGGIYFEIRRKPDEGYPERFLMEVKSKGQIVRRFEITGIKPDWQARQIDFFAPSSMPITEVTIVFSNAAVGSSKSGYMQLKNIQLIPLTEDQKRQRARAEKNPLLNSVSKIFTSSSPSSEKSTKITLPIKKLRSTSEKDTQAGTGQVGAPRKIAEEIPKAVSLADLSD